MIIPISQPKTPTMAENTVTASAINSRAKNQVIILSNINKLYPIPNLSQ